MAGLSSGSAAARTRAAAARSGRTRRTRTSSRHQSATSSSGTTNAEASGSQVATVPIPRWTALPPSPPRTRGPAQLHGVRVVVHEQPERVRPAVQVPGPLDVRARDGALVPPPEQGPGPGRAAVLPLVLGRQPEVRAAPRHDPPVRPGPPVRGLPEVVELVRAGLDFDQQRADRHPEQRGQARVQEVVQRLVELPPDARRPVRRLHRGRAERAIPVVPEVGRRAAGDEGESGVRVPEERDLMGLAAERVGRQPVEGEGRR